MLEEIASVMNRVKKLLENYPHLRDSDNKLVANIWNQEKKDTDAFGFLTMYASGEITTADSITRARRKLQELHPELRGRKYSNRHREEKRVRTNINTL